VPAAGGDDTATPGWRWDPTLYAGSARHYAAGRVAYPVELADVLTAELGLDRSGLLLDVGCGPGSLTLLLAPRFAGAIGIDADPDMLVEAARLAREADVDHVTWRQLRAEELPADLPRVRVVTFAQSFHWMDRLPVAVAARALLEPGGAVVHVHATTHEGVAGEFLPTHPPLPHPLPPRAAVRDLVQRHLGPERRAGQGVLPAGTAGGEDAVYRQAGLTGPRRLELPGRVVERTAEQVVSSVHSLSSAAPHLFGDRLAAFDAELRALLGAASPSGRFSEVMGPTGLDVWR